MDAEARDDVLGAVAGEDAPGLGRAGEGARGPGPRDGGVERQVDGEGLCEAVGVVVRDVADLETCLRDR